MKLLNLFKKMENKQEEKLNVNILLNFRCNLRCKMCYIWRDTSNYDMQTDKWVNLIRSLENFKKDYSMIEVNIGGGEPFLEKSIFKIFSECNKLGIRSNVTTNGTLLTKNVINKSIKSGLSGITFSLDSHKASVHDKIRGVKGTFNKVMKSMYYISQTKKLEVSISTTIMKSNLDDIVPLARWVQRMKTVAHSFQAVNEPLGKLQIERWYEHEDNKEIWPDNIEKVEKVIDELIKIKQQEDKTAKPIIMNTPLQFKQFENYFKNPEDFIKHKGCNIVDKNSITINPDGSVFICPSMDPVGNIKEFQLQNILESKTADRTIKIMNTCEKNCHHLMNCYYEDEK